MLAVRETLDLWDYRRRVADLYTEVRAAGGGEEAWRRWRAGRDLLFGRHPQSALSAEARRRFGGLPYFPYEAAWRCAARVEPAEVAAASLAHSGAGDTAFRQFGRARFSLPGAGEVTLALFWLDSYGGGVFLPFRDATNGKTTYGGGRYLLDTAKGADLGHGATTLTLDFNYSYHPSCAHDERWSCPLAPAENILPVAVEAGERLR